MRPNIAAILRQHVSLEVRCPLDEPMPKLQCRHCMADILGVFEQAVLLAVVRLDSDAYGRSIFGEVQARLERPVAAGAVQATLDRLERKGLVTSDLGEGTEARAGRPRRYYRLRPAGRRALDEARVTVDNLWRGIKRPLKGAV